MMKLAVVLAIVFGFNAVASADTVDWSDYIDKSPPKKAAPAPKATPAKQTPAKATPRPATKAASKTAVAAKQTKVAPKARARRK